MRQTKYITSGGLAFSENKDMEKLHSYSAKGWHVSNFKFMGYTLERGEAADYIYSVDYRWLDTHEEAEYFDFFSASGWSHVTSSGNIHLFLAHPGTKPIYTDRDTTAVKYENSGASMLKLAIPLVLLTAFVWLGVMVSAGPLKSLFLLLAAIFSAIAFPMAGTAITTYGNKWKAEGRRGLANIMKATPAFLLLITVIILLFVRGTGTTIDIVTSMVIGAIVFPVAIWMIMSLYYKINGKRG